MTDEQIQNLLTTVIEMKNHLERMAEKQEEMHEDIKKIDNAIYHPEQGIYARLRAIETWKDTMSKVIWTIATGFIALALNTLYQNIGG
tara:strand:- start:392 stop:655 length:264 start_codon:yes stop_codon:yes gene_type:complete